MHYTASTIFFLEKPDVERVSAVLRPELGRRDAVPAARLGRARIAARERRALRQRARAPSRPDAGQGTPSGTLGSGVVSLSLWIHVFGLPNLT